MAEGRRRVRERFGIELEPEVQALGPVELPAEWTRGHDPREGGATRGLRVRLRVG